MLNDNTSATQGVNNTYIINTGVKKSPMINEIAKALSDFQGEVKNPDKSANNPFFKSKYAPLDTLLNEARPILAKYGLAILQSCSGDNDKATVTTLLTHSSGQWIESEPLTLKATKADPQGIGSAITYARRYALSAILGIVGEEDDDGNSASGNNANAKDKAGTEKKDTPIQQKISEITTAFSENINKVDESDVDGRKKVTDDMYSLVEKISGKKNFMGLKDVKVATEVLKAIKNFGSEDVK
jgi:hypothetical protein